MNKKIIISLKWLSILIIAGSIIAMILVFNKNIGFATGGWITHSSDSILSNSSSSGGPGRLQTHFMQVLITFFGGGALGVAGALLQKVTKNRLAEVSILGIGSINIFFIYGYVMIFKNQAFGNGPVAIMMPIFLVLVSIFGTLIVWAISRSKHANKNTFVIVGIALQLLVEALSVLVVNPTKLIKSNKGEGKKIWNRIKGYTLGKVRSGIQDKNGISNPVTWWLMITAIVAITSVIIIIFFLRKKIDTYETSEDLAFSSGINIKRLRLVIYILTAILAGFTSAILGSVALLGIIAPSVARLLFKNKMWPITIASFLIGGMMVAGASFVSLQLDIHVSVGILATAIVIPYFIFLMIREK